MKFHQRLCKMAAVVLAATFVSLGQAQEEQAPLLPMSLANNAATINEFGIPSLGFGTWLLNTTNATEAVSYAIQTGYRHIDAAAIYGNEKEVGLGIKDGLSKVDGLKREHLWVTSKLWNDHHDPRNVSKGLNESLTRLGLDYLDLYLMHWPVAETNGSTKIEFKDTWKAMQLLSPSLVRHKGICNFSPSQVMELLEIAKPVVHQMEMHPYLTQSEFLEWHQSRGIVVTAYSPLGNTNPIYNSTGKLVPPLLTNPAVKSLADERNCSSAHVVLEWGLMRGTVVIPKAQRADHIKENFAVSAGGGEKCHPPISHADVANITESLPVKRFNNPGAGWNVHLFDDLQDNLSFIMKLDPGFKIKPLDEVTLERIRNMLRELRERCFSSRVWKN